METKFEDYGGKYRPNYAVAKIKSETKSVFTNNSAKSIQGPNCSTESPPTHSFESTLMLLTAGFVIANGTLIH